jgi:hypothetical protein
MHTLLDVLAWGTFSALACAALILIFGAEYLSWWCVPAAGVISLAAGWWVVRTRLPSPYEVAQSIDRRLQLADTLSTACHFSSPADSKSDSIRAAQRLTAEELVPSVDLKTALPLHRPAGFYPAIGAVLLVAGLFIMRYAVQGSFDPRPSLVKNAIDNFFAGTKQQALATKSPGGEQPGDKDGEKAEQKNADFAGDSQFDPAAPEPQASPDADKTADSKKKDDEKSENSGADKGDKGDKGDDKQAGDQKQDGDQKGTQDAKADPSVMDKLKEAVNDLINKMKAPNDAKNQKGEPQSDADKQPSDDGQNQEKNQGDSADAQKSSQQSADGENGKNSDQKKKSDSPQQGVGSQEGDKTAKEAEARKAMGKISELLGKRSENVKGTVTMEVGQTKQTLKTLATESNASHNEAGGEIHRDTIPPAYEGFVQQYFEQVRKMSTTKSPAIPPAK